MRIPDPKANTTTEAYLAYKAGYLEESELKPVLYEPYLHFDAWLAYWAGLTSGYPKNYGKNLCQELSGFNSISSNGATDVVKSGNSVSFTTSVNGRGIFMTSTNGNNYTYCPELYSTGYVCSVEISATKASQLQIGVEGKAVIIDVDTTPKRVSFKCYGNAGERVAIIFYRRNTTGDCSYTISNIQVEKGSEATDFEEYSTTPEMLTDEEALVAYLAGVTETYPEDIKDPYDVRIVGYLKHLASIRWPEPDYPVNNEEFYLSTMEPTHTSNPEPSADIELDTVDGNIISVEAYGDTYQQTYTGKNLLYIPTGTSASNGITWTRNGNTVSGTGTGTGSYSATSGWLSYTLPAGTYTFSIGEAVTKRVQFARRVDSSSPAQTVNLPAGDTSITFTSTEATSEYHVVLLDTSGASLTNYTIKDMQLEVGSEATSFEPYVGGIPAPNPEYPQDIHVVTGEQTVTVTGKNLIPITPNTLTKNGLTATISADGTMVINGTSTATTTFAFANASDRKNIPAGTYTLSANNQAAAQIGSGSQLKIAYEVEGGGSSDISGATVNMTSINATSTFTTKAERQRISVYARFASGVTLNNFTLRPQLEVGSTATDYEPYQSQSYTVDLGTTELCKIGDYQDYIYKSGDDWYLHKDCGKIELDGSNDETWSIVGSGTPNFFYAYNSIPNYLYTGLAQGFICSAGVGASIGSTTTATGVSITNVAEFRIRYGTEMTLANWKSYLSSTPMSVYYRLATPTDTQLTDATLVGQLEALANADTYNEKTYIKVTANDPILPALLKVEAYKY